MGMWDSGEERASSWTTSGEIDQRIAAARRRLAALGDVEPHAEYGGRAEELARFGASVDLLVIGPRDQEGESALHLAPLALRLAHHAPCP
jgi:nucleotide-binding universal stress UspA family protein